MLDIIKCKRKIAIIWGFFSLILYTIIFIQTLSGKHDGYTNEIWGWLLQSTLPTLTLTIGMITFDTYNPSSNENISINKFTFYIASTLSIVYLSLILTIILYQPISGKPLWQLGSSSNIYLAPIQGLVSGVVGLFFSKANK
jgi:hypothetical protein